MTDVYQTANPGITRWGLRVIAFAAVLGLGATHSAAQEIFPLRDIRPGLHGVGRTVFHGDRIEDFQVEIIGVLENAGPNQSVIIAKLSGGPLQETGVLEGMSGSPVYIDGKLAGAVALGFAFAKETIAGIQPIEQMIADATFTPPAEARTSLDLTHRAVSWLDAVRLPARSSIPLPAGNLTEILTPISLSGFTPATLQTFAADFRRLGFEPQQGVSGATTTSQRPSRALAPGSMISVELTSGDMSIRADGTITYVKGNRIYAFGHQFLDSGETELPFTRAEVVGLVPTLSTSFKVSAAREWAGTITSDRSTAIAGEIGRPSHTIPVTIGVHSATGDRNYHFRVVNDRLLTPFLTQTVIFSTIDATDRTLGAGTLRLNGRVNFEGDIPPLVIQDVFVSDSGLAQQAAADAVVSLAFALGADFSDLRIASVEFRLEAFETKRQLQISQVWTSAHEVRPGQTVEITALLSGGNGVEFLRTATYRVPIGAPAGELNFTVSDANGLNFPEFAGLSASSFRTPQRMIGDLNRFRASDAAYVRVWRQEPSFSVSGPPTRGDLSDPPPSAALILANSSASVSTSVPVTVLRGSDVAELAMLASGYAVSGGSKTVQVEVKE